MQSVFLLLPPRRANFHEMQEQPPHQLSSSSNSLRDLLLESAAAVSASDWQRAIRFLVILSRAVSPNGDANERLAAYFSAALSRCIYSLAGRYDSTVHSLLYNHSLLNPDFLPQHQQQFQQQQHEFDLPDEEECAAYRALNQVTPFIRFAHLSANQAILEAIDKEKAVHIVDLDVMQGLQWPPLMQALVERRRLKLLELAEDSQAATSAGGNDEDTDDCFAISLRITGTGPSMPLLERTGARLRDFASMLNLEFEFGAVCTHDDQGDDFVALRSHLELREDEALVVNCMTQLHRLLPAGRTSVGEALDFIKSVSPRIVTVAEKEFEHDVHQGFMERFAAGLDHYSAVFDSLEATLSPRNLQRLMIERVVLAKEITGIVLEDDGVVDESEQHLVIRYQSFTRWRRSIEDAGFHLVPPSDFSIAQARLLLRLHYPADGYRLLSPDNEQEQDGLFLCWHNKPLVAVSAWCCR